MRRGEVAHVEWRRLADVVFLIGTRIQRGDSRSKPGGGQTHFHCRFAHPIESVTARFGRRTFIDKIPEDGCCGQDGEIDIIQSLNMVNEDRVG